MANATIEAGHWPAARSTVLVAIGPLAEGVYNAAAYFRDPEGPLARYPDEQALAASVAQIKKLREAKQPVPLGLPGFKTACVVTTDDPYTGIAIVLGLAARYQCHANLELISKVSRGRMPHPTAAYDKDGHGRPYLSNIETGWTLRSFLHRVGLQMKAGERVNAGKAPLQLPEALRVGTPEKGFAPACGAEMTIDGPRLADPCLSGGPCKHTGGGKCWRIGMFGAASTEEVEAPMPAAAVPPPAPANEPPATADAPNGGGQPFAAPPSPAPVVPPPASVVPTLALTGAPAPVDLGARLAAATAPPAPVAAVPAAVAAVPPAKAKAPAKAKGKKKAASKKTTARGKKKAASKKTTAKKTTAKKSAATPPPPPAVTPAAPAGDAAGAPAGDAVASAPG